MRGTMRRLIVLLGFLLGMLTGMLIGILQPMTAYANHGMVTGPECGTYESHLEDDYVKGRTDSMIFHVDYAVGCKHAILSGVVAAGIGEAQGNAWQVGPDGKSGECLKDGREYAVGLFDYYWHTKIDPETVTVKCTPWKGHD